eukprot:COSAG02_NODE_2379_length_8997_cov_13.958193_7_plen_175_part_00
MPDVATIDGACLGIVVRRLLAAFADVLLHATTDMITCLAAYETTLLVPVAGLAVRAALSAVRAGRTRRGVCTQAQIRTERPTVCCIAGKRRDNCAMACHRLRTTSQQRCHGGGGSKRGIPSHSRSSTARRTSVVGPRTSGNRCARTRRAHAGYVDTYYDRVRARQHYTTTYSRE